MNDQEIHEAAQPHAFFNGLDLGPIIDFKCSTPSTSVSGQFAAIYGRAIQMQQHFVTFKACFEKLNRRRLKKLFSDPKPLSRKKRLRRLRLQKRAERQLCPTE